MTNDLGIASVLGICGTWCQIKGTMHGHMVLWGIAAILMSNRMLQPWVNMPGNKISQIFRFHKWINFHLKNERLNHFEFSPMDKYKS